MWVSLRAWWWWWWWSMFWWFFFLIFRWWHRSGSWRSSRIYRKILLHLAVLVLLSFSPIRKVFFFFFFFVSVFFFAWFVTWFLWILSGVQGLDGEVLSFFIFIFVCETFWSESLMLIFKKFYVYVCLIIVCFFGFGS